MAKITVGDLNLTGVSSTPFLRDNSCQLRMVKPGVSFKQITAVLAANEADDILFEASDGRLFVLSEDALSSGWHLDEFAVFGERVSVPDSIVAGGLEGTVRWVNDERTNKKVAMAQLRTLGMVSAKIATVAAAAGGALGFGLPLQGGALLASVLGGLAAGVAGFAGLGQWQANADQAYADSTAGRAWHKDGQLTTREF